MRYDFYEEFTRPIILIRNHEVVHHENCDASIEGIVKNQIFIASKTGPDHQMIKSRQLQNAVGGFLNVLIKTILSFSDRLHFCLFLLFGRQLII